MLNQLEWQLANWTFSQDWVFWACPRLGMSDILINDEPSHMHTASKVQLQALAELAIEAETIECIAAIKQLAPPFGMSAEAASGYRAGLVAVMEMLQERMAGRPQIPLLKDI